MNVAASSSVKSLDITFMAANAVGIVLYLVLASRGWRIPQEHGAVPVTGEPFVWVLGAARAGSLSAGESCVGRPALPL